jgi:hypothetical protein
MPQSFNILIYTTIIILSSAIIVFIILKIIRSYFRKQKHLKNVIFLVRLPKDKPDQEREQFNQQTMREEISKAETIFSSIGGLRAERTFKSYIFGREDLFSFELVAQNKKIAFYVVAPEKMARYIEQQIHAHYPEASVEEQDDYNMFKPNSEVIAGYQKTVKDRVFPLKSYEKQESDPMNSLINVMSKLDPEEGMAIQFLVRSAKAEWHQSAVDLARHIHKGRGLKESIKLIRGNFFWRTLKDIFYQAKPTNQQNQMYSQMPRMTQMEEESLKGIEEKNSKAGLDVNLRIIVSSKNKGQARLYLDNLSNAFTIYNFYEYGNNFLNKIRTMRQNRLIKDFIYRRFDRHIQFLLNTAELASLFHFPLRNAETPNILWLTARHAAAPNNIPDSGLLLGHNVYRGQVKEIYISKDDRRRHMYIIGKSGGGKSKFIANMAIQDIINGEGLAVLDPHGDLIEDILKRVPPERAEDVVIFSPYDLERPLGLNLIEFDPNYPEQKTFLINEMIKIFDKLYDLKSTGGPIFEQYMRNALLLIMAHPESGSTLMEVPKVLSNPEFRKMKLANCADQTVVDFWRQEAEKAGGDAALANVVPYITSKLTQFISNDTMRPIIGQQKSAFNIREIMDKQKILLIDLSKGRIGEMNAFLLGMILIGKILMSALSRADLSDTQRKDFYLYIDEFQNFTTDSISSILSEARKYGLNLIVAHQYLGQLVKNQDTSIKDAVFGNVGTWVSLKIGSEDAETLAKEFNPVFNQYDLLNVDKFSAYVRLLIDNTPSRPFSMKMPWPLQGEVHDGISQKIRTLSRLKFGKDRNLIEAEIRKRTI